MILIYGGIFFWPYWLSVRGLLLIAKRLRFEHPGGLFGVSCALLVMFSMAMSPVSLLMTFVPWVGPLLMVLVALSGVIGWIVLAVKRARNRAKVRAFRQAHPLPKMQFGIMELMIAVFYFAAWMALGAVLLDVIFREDANYGVGVLAVYLFSTTALGFYVSLDVLRRCEARPYGTWSRFGIVLACVILSSASALVGLLIAWRAWQRVLLTLGMEKHAPPTSGGSAVLQSEPRRAP